MAEFERPKKSENLHIRISTYDKEELARLATNRAMTISEYLTYLIRREAEKSREA